MNKLLTLSLDDILVQAEGNIVSDMDGEKVMLSVMKGKYYNLGEVGGEIWSCMSTPVTVQKIISHITSAYEVEPHVCRSDVLSFLSHLLDEGLVRVAESS